MTNETAAFQRLMDIIVRLRGPGGCPWDREQTPASLRGALIEETYECVEAIDEQSPEHIREELGDLFLLITMLSYIHEQEGRFSVADVLNGLSDKLIRRHPHVFEAKAAAKGTSLTSAEGTSLTSDEVLVNWARIKVEQEGRKPKDAILDGVSRSLPPLDRAFKLQKKAAKAGFDWTAAEDVIAKVREELTEAAEAAEGADRGALEEELGDLLFAAVNLCRYWKVEPSVALQRTNSKFINRFNYVERRMKEQGLALVQENLDRMDRYWEEAKTR